jgi:hypothetical protein
VQPWGSDGDKRRYFLIEGIDDTSFRVYRESNPAGLNRTWWSVAGSIDDLRVLSDKLETQDGGPKAKTFAKRILASIPRFEATEEKRRRREYRQMRKEQFRRPEPGFSLYEGRTRGKRMKYTYSDDEADFYTDSTTARRSTRNTRHHTPAEPSGPVTTASGRQVRAPARLNAENASSEVHSASASVQGDGEDSEARHVTRSGRPQRSAAAGHGMNGWAGGRKRKSDEYESDESEQDEGGSEPDYGDDEEEEHIPEEEEDDEDEEEFEDAELADDELADVENPSLVFKFPIRVSFDENSKVHPIPGGSPVAAEKHKHPRFAHAHRNVVVSEDSETSGVSPGEPIVATEPEPPAAEVIAVATKRLTVQDSQEEANVGKPVEEVANKPTIDEDQQMADASPVVERPPTPSSEQPASLAIRGSPEVARVAPRPVDAASAE